MKVYQGFRPVVGPVKVTVQDDGGEARPLRHVVHHSPTGFEWGYPGSGPADLAMSILADYLGEKPSKADIYYGRVRCWMLKTAFKDDFVAQFRKEGWTLTGDQIKEWLEEKR